MQHEKLKLTDVVAAGLIAAGGIGEAVRISGFYTVECVGADGKVRWVAETPNIVTTLGANDLLNKYFDAATTTFRVGLKGTGTAVAGDTMASHAGWLEVGGTNAPQYTGNRQNPTWNAAASKAKASNVMAFVIVTAGGTVAGCFMVAGGSNTKDDTSGLLYSAGDFTGGSRTVQIGDTLNVTYTATA